MKLAEIKVGGILGAVDNPRSNYRRTPRQVEVVEIVIEEERTFSNYTSTPGVRKVKRIKIKVLDGSTERSHGYSVAGSKKGDVLIVHPRQLVAQWSELAPNIRAKAEAEQKIADAEAALVARVTAILGKRHANEWGYWHVTTSGGRIELELDDAKVIDKLLAFAEVGVMVEQSRVKANADV